MIRVPVITSNHGLRTPESFPIGYLRLEIQGDEAVFWMPGDDLPELDPVTPDPDPPNWTQFLRSMLLDDHYKAIANQHWQVSRFESAVMSENPDSQIIQLIWNQFIEGIQTPIASDAIDNWNTIAARCNLPVRFAPNGEI